MLNRASVERAMQLDQLMVACGQTRKFNRPSLKRADTSGTIERFWGSASFVGTHEVRFDPAEGNPDMECRHITAENFLICTGAGSRSLVKLPVDGEYIVTPKHLLKLESWPESALILGARANGCEIATILRAFGAKDGKVFLVDGQPGGEDRLFPQEDEELSSFVESSLERSGVKIFTSSKLEFAQVHEDRGTVECRVNTSVTMPPHPDDPQQKPGIHSIRKTVHVQKLILCAGRVPNTQDLNLGVVGVDLDERGGIIVDEQLRSVSATHVCAAGDVVGRVGLVNVSETEARYAVESLYESEDAEPVDYDGVCSQLFLQTQISCVGMCEAEAQRRRIPYIVARVGLELIQPVMGRMYGLVDTSGDQLLHLPGEVKKDPAGFVKIIVSNDADMRLLGLRVCGATTSSVLQTASVMIHSRAHIKNLAYAMYAYPGVAEAVLECARLVLGTNFYKVHAFPETCYVHTWTPGPLPEGEDADGQGDWKPVPRRQVVPSYVGW
eukprot:CAMPEP_0206228294 /NCGR_PEP_ID=MMETSP0047_2-20121206/9094_1 /ASSEMBLY_ACC=CAM_ASM_000192 /TAXON_ID=195065 /ORGANISM="Chroomonas mesostigmatica_cf, Strain CCMP1168" /LENGTH=496 /DNA_ID=CAMNT_0053651531 /DNA_START=189 /DNA_END=1679 /DNA_ORIENTATION=-